jgi:hypothetical protein
MFENKDLNPIDMEVIKVWNFFGYYASSQQETHVNSSGRRAYKKMREGY